VQVLDLRRIDTPDARHTTALLIEYGHLLYLLLMYLVEIKDPKDPLGGRAVSPLLAAIADGEDIREPSGASGADAAAATATASAVEAKWDHSAMTVFHKRTGRLEIFRDDRVEVLYFPRAVVTDLLRVEDRTRIIDAVDRTANATEKIYDFQERVKDLKETLYRRRDIGAQAVLRVLTSTQVWWIATAIMMTMTAAINILLMVTMDPSARTLAIRVLGAVQLAAIVLQLTNKMLLDFNTNMRERFRWRMRRERRKGNHPGKYKQVLWKIRYFIDGEVVYRFLSLAASILGQAHVTFWYSFNMLEFLVATPARPVLINVLRSVTKNGVPLLLVLLLGVVVVYIFAIFAYIYFQDLIVGADGTTVRLCSVSLRSCIPTPLSICLSLSLSLSAVHSSD
jgi:hypothetical protein